MTDEATRLFSSRDGMLWPSRGLGIVVNVCEACNNGWMADLEAAFSARFSEAILGHADTFGAGDLAVFARWSAKTSLLLQLQLEGTGEATHVPHDHLRAVMEDVPPQTRVWIGAYAPRARYTFWQGVPMAPAGVTLGPGAPRVGYVMLVAVGHLLAVVLSLDAHHGDDFEVEGLPPFAFTPVWPQPTEPLDWPGALLILNDNGIATFWPPRRPPLIIRAR